MKVLVCGGAGYIGAHMCKLLRAHGHAVTVFDNLSTGHRRLARWGQLHEGDLLNPGDLDSVFASCRFDVVMHFAGLIAAGESVQQPERYYRNNVTGSMNLLDAMQRSGVQRLVFSSSAAVYGDPARLPIRETETIAPINPYGENKARVEHALLARAAGQGLTSVSLRYFNAAGADPAGEVGECHAPETHLIPNLLAAAMGSQPVQIYGSDYPTPDGTCIRDYIHVNDLCEAHLAAAKYMETHPGAHAFNLGNGKGFSVREVVHAVEQVTGRTVRAELAPRRPGDPPVLVADAQRARIELGWRPQYTDIRHIIETAWHWHRQQS